MISQIPANSQTSMVKSSYKLSQHLWNGDQYAVLLPFSGIRALTRSMCRTRSAEAEEADEGQRGAGRGAGGESRRRRKKGRRRRRRREKEEEDERGVREV